MDSLFPTAEVMDECISFVVAYVAYGMGLGLIVFVLGYVIWFLIQVLR